MFRRYFLWLAIALVVFVCPTVFAGTIALSITPLTQGVNVASVPTVAIQIAGLADPPSLGTFDLYISFSPIVLSLNNVLFGDPGLGDQLDPTGLGNTINFFTPSVGGVELFELSLDTSGDLNSLQASSFTLATVAFNAISAGTSPVNLTVSVLGDADGNSLSANINNGSITVGSNSVPEPSTLIFISGALPLLLLSPRLTTRAKCRIGKALRIES
jgi:hypothetical protein